MQSFGNSSCHGRPTWGLGWQGRPGARVQKMDLKLAPGQVEIIPLHGVADPTKSTTSTTSDDPMTSDASC